MELRTRMLSSFLTEYKDSTRSDLRLTAYFLASSLDIPCLQFHVPSGLYFPAHIEMFLPPCICPWLLLFPEYLSPYPTLHFYIANSYSGLISTHVYRLSLNITIPRNLTLSYPTTQVGSELFLRVPKSSVPLFSTVLEHFIGWSF